MTTTTTMGDQVTHCRASARRRVPARVRTVSIQTSIQMNKRRKLASYRKCSNCRTRWTVCIRIWIISARDLPNKRSPRFRSIATSRQREGREFEAQVRESGARTIYRESDVCVVCVPVDECHTEKEVIELVLFHETIVDRAFHCVYLSVDEVLSLAYSAKV